METSARTRGNPRLVDHHHIEVGNFRAYTGQPSDVERRYHQYGKLPRVHGATGMTRALAAWAGETSARTRGNRSHAHIERDAQETSARTRGNPFQRVHAVSADGNFRAYTGQPSTLMPAPPRGRKLPRVHGATPTRSPEAFLCRSCLVRSAFCDLHALWCGNLMRVAPG